VHPSPQDELDIMNKEWCALTKETLVALFSLHYTRNVLALIFVTGWIVYYVDYKKMRNNMPQSREVKVAHIACMVYMFGSLAGFIILQVFNWLV
jgi:hypothetical protein